MAISQLTRVVPSSTIPGIVLPVFQEVPFKELFPENQQIGDAGDAFLYITTLEGVQPTSSVGQQWKSADPVRIANNQLSFPVYTISTRREHDIDDALAFNKIVSGVSLLELEEQLMQMATYQRVHYGAMFGFSSADKQGLVTASRQVPLPVGSTPAQTSITSYDPAELARFLLSMIRDVQNTTFSMAKPIIITSSSRIINYLASSIVSLEKSQKDGGGVDSIGGLVNRITLNWLGAGNVTFIKDDLLKGSAVGGADYISIVAPGLSKQEFTEGYPQSWGNNIQQYTANTLLSETVPLTITPNPDRDTVICGYGRMKITPGALVRYEASVTVTATY